MRTFLAAILAATSLAQTPAPATPLWSVTEGIDSPESVYYDAASGFLFSSQIVGNAAAHDGNGRIVKLTLDGKVVDANWVEGLDGPKGLRAYQRHALRRRHRQVVGYRHQQPAGDPRVKIADAKFLNDVAAAPDGAVYTTDSFANCVWVVRNGVASVFVDAPQLRAAERHSGRRRQGDRGDRRHGRGAGRRTPGSLFAIDIATSADHAGDHAAHRHARRPRDRRPRRILRQRRRARRAVSCQRERRRRGRSGSSTASLRTSASSPGRKLLVVPHRA